MKDKYYRLGCDIGGTFTDFVLLNDQTGEIMTGKCLTTPQDPSDAVEEGIRALEKTTPDFVGKLDELIHAVHGARDEIIGVEELTEDQIRAVRVECPPKAADAA